MSKYVMFDDKVDYIKSKEEFPTVEEAYNFYVSSTRHSIINKIREVSKDGNTFIYLDRDTPSNIIEELNSKGYRIIRTADKHWRIDWSLDSKSVELKYPSTEVTSFTKVGDY